MNNQNIYKWNIPFKDYNCPIEIFCEEKYQDYYIRGQIIEFSDENHFHLVRDANVSYRIVLFILANNKYFNIFKSRDVLLNSEFGQFFAGTPQDFIEMQKIQDSKYPPSERQALGIKGINNNPIILINQNEVPIPDNQYLRDSIESKKDKILLDLHAYVNNSEDYLRYPILCPEAYVSFKPVYLYRIHALCGYQFSNESYHKHDEFIDWFDHLYEMFYWYYDYKYLEKREFYDILRNIGELSYRWIKYSVIDSEYLKLLNTFKNKINIAGDLCPLKKFCYSFFDDLIQNLETTGIIKKCEYEYCHDYFPYKNNKKYCSIRPKYENKNCQRQAAEHRRYLRKKLKNLNE